MKKEKIYLDFVGLDGYIFRGDNGEDIAFVWKDFLDVSNYSWKIKLDSKLNEKDEVEKVSFKRISDVKHYLRLVGNKMKRHEW